MDHVALGNCDMEKEHAVYPYDQSEPYISINNEDMEKQCCEKIDVMQLVECQSQLSSSHIDFPYDLELLGAYTVSYHSVSLDVQYEGVVNLPHHSDLYINPVQSWIEASCASTYQFGRKFDDIIHAYDFPSILPLPNHQAGLHFLNKVSLLWLVTKDKDFFFMLIKCLGAYIGLLITLEPFYIMLRVGK